MNGTACTLFSKRNLPFKIHQFFLMTLGQWPWVTSNFLNAPGSNLQKTPSKEHWKCWAWPRVTDPDPGSPGKMDEFKVHFFLRRVYSVTPCVLFVSVCMDDATHGGYHVFRHYSSLWSGNNSSFFSLSIPDNPELEPNTYQSKTVPSDSVNSNKCEESTSRSWTIWNRLYVWDFSLRLLLFSQLIYSNF